MFVVRKAVQGCRQYLTELVRNALHTDREPSQPTVAKLQERYTLLEMLVAFFSCPLDTGPDFHTKQRSVDPILCLFYS